MNPEYIEELKRLQRQLTEVSSGINTLLGRMQVEDIQLAPSPSAVPVQDPNFWTNNPAQEEPVLKMTGDQERAWQKINAWLSGSHPFFLLRGVAGSGKSFLMQKVVHANDNIYLTFCAPTNKATGVLSAFLKMPCKTIYSLLGFRMTPNEDKLELTASDMENLPRLPRGSVIVIDEAGMLPKFMVTLIQELATERGWRFICVGDPYQLNPVGERTSAVWKLTKDPDCRVMMTEVKRFDNELLALSIDIRAAIKARDFVESPIKNNNSNGEGVFTWTSAKAIKFIQGQPREFWRDNKVACWRNKTVNKYNDLVRSALGYTDKFVAGEMILLGSPVVEEQRIIAHTDEELEVAEVLPAKVKIADEMLLADELIIRDRNFRLTIPREPERYQAILSRLATEARNAGRSVRNAWAPFWEAKSQVHDARYGYALTAHRLQGSTTRGIYADQSDILANADALEAFRMLYVVATRPTNRLVAF